MREAEDPLVQPIRRELYDLVSRRPGLHLRAIGRETGLPVGQVVYHLGRLERTGLLGSRRDGTFKRYFATRFVDRHEKEVYAALRHVVPRRMAIALLSHAPRSQRELTEEVHVAPSTLSFHARRLVASGFLVKGPRGLELADPRRTLAALVESRDSFADPAVDRFVSDWLRLRH